MVGNVQADLHFGLAMAYLQSALFRPRQFPVLASNPVEGVVVLCVVALIKHLQCHRSVTVGHPCLECDSQGAYNCS